jgi:hypothetical protein
LHLDPQSINLINQKKGVIDLNSTLFDQSMIFIPEAIFPVMLLLIFDVVGDHIFIPVAIDESTVSCSPSVETGKYLIFLYPEGSSSFDVSYKIGQGYGGMKIGE